MTSPIDEAMRDFAEIKLLDEVHEHKMAESWKEIKKMNDSDKLSEILIRLRGWKK